MIQRVTDCARTCARGAVRTLVRTPGWLRRRPAEVVSITLLLIVAVGTLDAYLTR